MHSPPQIFTCISGRSETVEEGVRGAVSLHVAGVSPDGKTATLGVGNCNASATRCTVAPAVPDRHSKHINLFVNALQKTCSGGTQFQITGAPGDQRKPAKYFAGYAWTTRFLVGACLAVTCMLGQIFELAALQSAGYE